MLNNDEQQVDLLREKPQRKTRPRFAPFLFLIGGAIILSTLLVVVWQATTSIPTDSNVGNQPGKQGAKGSTTTDDHAPWDNYPPVYWQTLRAQMAQGLHMSEQQMISQLQADFPVTANGGKGNGGREIRSGPASKWLGNLARDHGLSPEQLLTLKKNAILQAHTALVSQHVLTQQQADENSSQLLALDQDSLSLHIVAAFDQCDSGKAAC